MVMPVNSDAIESGKIADRAIRSIDTYIARTVAASVLATAVTSRTTYANSAPSQPTAQPRWMTNVSFRRLGRITTWLRTVPQPRVVDAEECENYDDKDDGADRNHADLDPARHPGWRATL